MGSLISYIIAGIKYAIMDVILPMAQILLYFMFIVLIVTFIANISGILGFFIFMIMFYYYVKGIIYIEPAYANNVIK
jgi:hypothetical protein